MFYKTKSAEFGKKLKNIRESFGYTQLNVSRLTKISVDALRRIENGYVTPRIETLITLSRLYKQDLLQTLMTYCREPSLIEAYNQLQRFIDTEDVEGINEISKNIDDFTLKFVEDGVILIEEIEQFVLFCNASVYYISNTPEDLVHSKTLIMRCFELSISSFSLELIEQYIFSVFEVRMLNLLALTEQRLNEHLVAIRIMKVLIDKMLEIVMEKDVIKHLNLLYFNLSYSYFEIGIDDTSLKYADFGIEHSIKHARLNELHLLYYRKGIAEYRLGNEGYMDALSKSITLLEAVKSPLVEIYRTVTKEQYGIEI